MKAVRDLRIAALLALLFAALAAPAIATATTLPATEHASTITSSPLDSASTPRSAKPKNRVSDFFFRSGARARADRPASRARAWENCYELRRKASASPLAAEDGAADLDALSASGREEVKNGLTRAGRAYAKHMGRGELPSVAGRELNSAGQDLLDGILTDPKTVQTAVGSGRFAGGTRFIGPNGVGATFDAKGVLQYFGIYK